MVIVLESIDTEKVKKKKFNSVKKNFLAAKLAKYDKVYVAGKVFEFSLKAWTNQRQKYRPIKKGI